MLKPCQSRMLPAAPKQTAKELCDVLLGSDNKDNKDVKRDETV